MARMAGRVTGRRGALGLLFGATALGAGGAPLHPAGAAEAAEAAADPTPYRPLASKPRRGGALTLGSLVQPPGLDPYHQAADARIRFTVLLYQGLFYEAPDGRAVPLLAEGHEVSPDGLTY